MIETSKIAEKTVLVFFAKKNENTVKIKESLDELKLLSATAGADVVKTFYQVSDSFDSRFMIGKGKVEEIAEYVEDKNVSLVIFENELSYTQLRNLEQKIKCKILDKSNLILDIFANNARTAQAKLQVELAQLEYLLPRLTRQWTHLSKQYGGIGTKGPGETQIETDRRLIKTKISVLKEKLGKIDRQRKTQALERKNHIRLSLVGYTNAGKSTLLNLLTDSNVYVEDKLFATLDTSTRALKLSNEKVKKVISRFPKKVLISDTVGFIKNLPHNLIESFKSTLSEVVESDILLHVIDASNPNFEEQMAVVRDTLDEIGAGSRKTINVFNKVDMLKDFELLSHLKEMHPDGVFISARKGLNVEKLLGKVKEELSSEYEERIIKIKKENYKLLSNIYKLAEVLDVKYLKTFTKATLRGTKDNLDLIEKLNYADNNH
ncbi:MAG: GTPase HflX [Ignavibacteriae bacterium]|nr:GTPase HflX [Ignavibacteriota bacterium]